MAVNKKYKLKLKYKKWLEICFIISLIVHSSIFLAFKQFDVEKMETGQIEFNLEVEDIPQTEQMEKPNAPDQPSIPVESEDEDIPEDITIKDTEINFGDIQIPPPPPEIEDIDIKIEYTSILAQAQQAVGITKVQRVLEVAAQTYETAQIADIIDADETIREVAEMEGAPAKMLLKKADLEAKRQAEAEAAQQQAQAEAMPAMAKAAKDASEAELGKGSMLDKMAENMAA